MRLDARLNRLEKAAAIGQAQWQVAEIAMKESDDEALMSKAKKRLMKQHLQDGGCSADSFIFIRYCNQTRLLAVA